MPLFSFLQGWVSGGNENETNVSDNRRNSSRRIEEVGSERVHSISESERGREQDERDTSTELHRRTRLTSANESSEDNQPHVHYNGSATPRVPVPVPLPVYDGPNTPVYVMSMMPYTGPPLNPGGLPPGPLSPITEASTEMGRPRFPENVTIPSMRVGNEGGFSPPSSPRRNSAGTQATTYEEGLPNHRRRSRHRRSYTYSRSRSRSRSPRPIPIRSDSSSDDSRYNYRRRSRSRSPIVVERTGRHRHRRRRSRSPPGTPIVVVPATPRQEPPVVIVPSPAPPGAPPPTVFVPPMPSHPGGPTIIIPGRSSSRSSRSSEDRPTQVPETIYPGYPSGFTPYGPGTAYPSGTPWYTVPGPGQNPWGTDAYPNGASIVPPPIVIHQATESQPLYNRRERSTTIFPHRERSLEKIRSSKQTGIYLEGQKTSFTIYGHDFSIFQREVDDHTKRRLDKVDGKQGAGLYLYLCDLIKDSLIPLTMNLPEPQIENIKDQARDFLSAFSRDALWRIEVNGALPQNIHDMLCGTTTTTKWPAVANRFRRLRFPLIRFDWNIESRFHQYSDLHEYRRHDRQVLFNVRTVWRAWARQGGGRPLLSLQLSGSLTETIGLVAHGYIKDDLTVNQHNAGVISNRTFHVEDIFIEELMSPEPYPLAYPSSAKISSMRVVLTSRTLLGKFRNGRRMLAFLVAFSGFFTALKPIIDMYSKAAGWVLVGLAMTSALTVISSLFLESLVGYMERTGMKSVQDYDLA
ncbi:hypothetical protein L218DRAFT_991405 [Marasmius fiardii PR-910]|nr:hypothetical protein L218DRAFT_991405 [Marasmius fiardii PR-910]